MDPADWLTELGPVSDQRPGARNADRASPRPLLRGPAGLIERARIAGARAEVGGELLEHRGTPMQARRAVVGACPVAADKPEHDAGPAAGRRVVVGEVDGARRVQRAPVEAGI